MPEFYILYEAASGYALFKSPGSEEIGSLLPQVQASLTSLDKFSSLVSLISFQPFSTAENALDNIMKISESVVSNDLKIFLENNLPNAKKMKKMEQFLGVGVHALGNEIQNNLGIPCKSMPVVNEMIRGIRLFFDKFVSKKLVEGGDMEQDVSTKAQLGLSHSYSRAKVKFNVHKQDNMVIQSICLLDQLDKDLNTCAMRVKEWYSWHFPELEKIISDTFMFSRLVTIIQDKKNLLDDNFDKALLDDVTQDPVLSQKIVESAKLSMGYEVSSIDMQHVTTFAERVCKRLQYRQDLHHYLVSKLELVAPNLSHLIGESVAARLISRAGSLTSLAKCPASTIQILGAEKALFRALKTKSNTPKYGLIFNSSFIGKASQKNKGRVSRYLANKCAIASRLDCFLETDADILDGHAAENVGKYGDKLREQVEERMLYLDGGERPRKNVDVMQEIHDEIIVSQAHSNAKNESKGETGKKRKKSEMDDAKTEEKSEKELKKEKKKAKKLKKEMEKLKAKEEESESSDSDKSDKADKKKKKKEKKEKKKLEKKMAKEAKAKNESSDGEDSEKAEKKKRKKEKKEKKKLEKVKAKDSSSSDSDSSDSEEKAKKKKKKDKKKKVIKEEKMEVIIEEKDGKKKVEKKEKKKKKKSEVKESN